MTSSGPLSPALIDERVNELRGRVEAKRAELGDLEAELQWWESGRRFFDPSDNGDAPTVTTPSDTKPTLRKAILLVMEEKPSHTWQAETIMASLRGRDWLPGGKNGEHRTRSMLAEMARDDGPLKRMGRGRYRLRSTEP